MTVWRGKSCNEDHPRPAPAGYMARQVVEVKANRRRSTQGRNNGTARGQRQGQGPSIRNRSTCTHTLRQTTDGLGAVSVPVLSGTCRCQDSVPTPATLQPFLVAPAFQVWGLFPRQGTEVAELRQGRRVHPHWKLPPLPGPIEFKK